jgi:hypothetical protein
MASSYVATSESEAASVPQRVSVRSNIDEFLESYRQAFTQLNAEAIANLFAYPCQLTSDAGEIEVTVVPTGEAWLPQLERLVAAYQAVGVRAAENGLRCRHSALSRRKRRQ